MEARAIREDRAVGPPDPSRRRFLKLVGVAAGTVLAETVVPARAAEASVPERVQYLAREHADDPAMLIDLSRCIGCGACVVACKYQNRLDWRDDQPWLGPEAELASANWTVVTTAQRDGGDGIRYVKSQCMHCLEPACASACPVKALRKQPLGAVTYDVNKCIGCRYCLMACPFGIPTFEWDRPISKVSKCSLCFERVTRGEATACAAACPVGAIQFGPRGQLLEEARRRITAEPDRYQPHIYGETEVGGTSVLYVSDVPFSELGFVQGLPERPLPDYTWEGSRLIPPVAAGLGALLVALYVRRRKVLLEFEGPREQEGASEGFSPEPSYSPPSRPDEASGPGGREP